MHPSLLTIAASIGIFSSQRSPQLASICLIPTFIAMGATNTFFNINYIDLAADIGCTRIRTFGGQRSRDREWSSIIDYVVDGYAQVIKQAQERNVIVLMETSSEFAVDHRLPCRHFTAFLKSASSLPPLPSLCSSPTAVALLDRFRSGCF